MTPLESVLLGRDERVAAQRRLLEAGEGRFLVQVSLNIPGCPKEIPSGRKIVESVYARLLEKTAMAALDLFVLENGAGVCVVAAFAGDEKTAVQMKEQALFLEEEECGSLFDVDVITKKGAVTRAALGRPPRRCLLCGDGAKVCAAGGAHDIAALRSKIFLLAHDYAAAHGLLE